MFPNKVAMSQDTSILHWCLSPPVPPLNPVLAEGDMEPGREEPAPAGCSLEASTRFSLLPSRDRQQRNNLTALPRCAARGSSSPESADTSEG